MLAAHLYSVLYPLLNMASISSLSGRTVWHILRYVFRVPILDQDMWKQYIPLLGVCHQWRSLIFHSMYQHVYIALERLPDDCVEGEFSLKSNIGLLEFSNRRHLASRMSIWLDGNLDFYRQMKTLLDRLVNDNSQWPGVRMLSIKYGITKVDRKQPATVMDDWQATGGVEQCASIGATLVRSIPCVRHLELQNHSSRHVPHTLASVLVAEYGRHLEYLCCDGLQIHPSLVHFSSMLRHLDVDFSRVNMTYFPAVLCERLERLSLSGLPHRFSMSHFAHCDRQMDVVFERLRSLVLRYKKRAEAECIGEMGDGARYRVYSPMLQSLIIENGEGCDVCSFSGQQLAHVNLSGSVRNIHRVCENMWGNINTLAITIDAKDKNDADNTEFYQTTNALYSQIHRQCRSKLEFKCSDIVLAPQKMHWPRLAMLYIHVAIGVNEFLHILQRLGGLNEAGAYDLVCSKFGDADGAGDADGVGFPKLKHVLLKRTARYNAVGHEQMVSVMAYLMTKVKSLNSVCTLAEFYDNIEGFRRRNVTRYSWFKRIRVHLR